MSSRKTKKVAITFGEENPQKLSGCSLPASLTAGRGNEGNWAGLSPLSGEREDSCVANPLFTEIRSSPKLTAAIEALAAISFLMSF